MKNDLFETLSYCLNPRQEQKNKKAFASAQSAWDNASPEDYGYEESDNEKELEALEFYKKAMHVAIVTLNEYIEALRLTKNVYKIELAEILDGEVEEIESEIKSREKRLK